MMALLFLTVGRMRDWRKMELSYNLSKLNISNSLIFMIRYMLDDTQDFFFYESCEVGEQYEML
jgi:hypothetical protein